MGLFHQILRYIKHSLLRFKMSDVDFPPKSSINYWLSVELLICKCCSFQYQKAQTGCQDSAESVLRSSCLFLKVIMAPPFISDLLVPAALASSPSRDPTTISAAIVPSWSRPELQQKVEHIFEWPLHGGAWKRDGCLTPAISVVQGILMLI